MEYLSLHWSVDEWGVALAPMDGYHSRSGGGRLLSVWLQLLRHPVLVHTDIKPLICCGQFGGREEACSYLGVHQKDFSYPAVLNGVFWPWVTLISPFPRAKENGRKYGSSTHRLRNIGCCCYLNACWAKHLPFNLCPTVRGREKIIGTEFTRTTGIFIIPLKDG